MCLGCVLGVEGMNHAVNSGNYGEGRSYTSSENINGEENNYGSFNKGYS
tara:strand:- start:4139 stop:4285 length:147 start_codon:yes stop_codon:yes gene_type:complete